MLEAERLVAGYGSLRTLNGITLSVKAHQVTLLTGPNGAGKSTLLKTLFGLVPLTSGEVRLEGRVVSGYTPRQMLALGVALVPQGRNLFPSLSVRHNLELGGITLAPRSALADRMEEVLQHFPRLRERIDNQASTLSGGEQKMLEVGRALLLRPRVILVDEPSLGLSPRLVQEVFRVLRRLAEAGTTILMVEQNLRRALAISDHALGMEMGRLVLDRPASQLLDDPDLNRLLLGGAAVPDATAGGRPPA